MFVPVEIQSGSWCIGILPVVIREKGLAQVEFFKAECVNTRTNSNHEREVELDFTDILKKTVWVAEFRICDFTFGGVLMSNGKFDPIRIDAEDAKWLKQNLTPDKTLGAPGSGAGSGAVAP